MAGKSLRMQVLGSTRVWNERAEVKLGPPGRRAVLGLLALAEGEAVATPDLVDALWGDRPPRSAVNVLQTHVKHLRRLLEPDRARRSGSEVLPFTNGGYALNPDVLDIDLLAFRRLVAEAGQPHRGADWAQVSSVLGKALGLWHGRPLADISLLATHPKVVSLVAQHREVLARYGDAMIAIGAVADVLPEIAEAAAEQPLDESAHARLIRAYHAAGRRARAFQTYHEIRDRLVDELGVDPGQELRTAHTMLLHDQEHDQDGGAAQPLPTTRVPRQLPGAPAGFTGRTTQLSTLDDLVPGSGGATVIAAISGTAGIGKTALAVHWAHRVRDRFPDGQLYANLRGHARGRTTPPIEVLAQFLSALGVPTERVPVDVEAASAMYRTLTTDRRMLVLLDNAASPGQVRPLLPAGPACLVVVTGRDRMTGLVAMHGARQLTLDVLGPDEAVDLLASVLGPRRIRAEQVAAAEFSKLCAYLPLALRVAAANLADRPACGIEDYVAELREGNLLAALTVQGDEQAAVRTAFDLSCAALEPEAHQLFRLLSLAPGTDVSTEAVAALAGTDPRRAERLLDRLAGAHLVENHLPGRYGFHDLLRRYAAEQLENRETAQERESALERLYDWYLHAVDGAARLLYPHMLRLPVPESDARMPSGVSGLADASSWLDSERGNLVAMVQAAARSGPQRMAWLLADALRGYFWISTRRVEWLATAEAGLAAAEETGEPGVRAAARLSLADLRFRQGRYREAVRHYAHADLLARRAGWVEAQSAVLGNLGCVYWQAGLLHAAAARFGLCLRLSRSIGQPIGEAVALGNLGLVHWEMGRLEEAAEHYTLALSRYRQIGSRYGEAINLGNLGNTQRARGLPLAAVELLAGAITLHHEGGNRSAEAQSRSRLAAAYRDLGRGREALDYALTGLALAQETGEPRAEVEALAVLAAVQHRFDDRTDAIRHYRRALDLVRSTGDRYPEVDILIGLAAATGDLTGARQALALAGRAGYRVLQGQAMSVVAEILLASGNVRESEEHARQALVLHHETGQHQVEALP